MGLDGRKMVGRGGKYRCKNGFYLLGFIDLFIHLFVCMIESSEKMIGENSCL